MSSSTAIFISCKDRLKFRFGFGEVIWFGSRASLNMLSSHDRTLTINESTTNTTDVCTMYVTSAFFLTPNCRRRNRLPRCVRVCIYHIRRLRQIR